MPVNSLCLCQETATRYYLADCTVQSFVLSHELIQENFKGVAPHFDRRLPPISLLLSHDLLQDLLKQRIKVFVADTLSIIHLQKSHRKSADVSFYFKIQDSSRFEWSYELFKGLTASAVE